MAADDPRIERVARALCEADGKDPEEDYLTGRTLTTRTRNSVSQKSETVPRWQTYHNEAKRFVAALDAAGR